ncbi:response regulator transcription factor [Trinickia caryophylli]|uniref:Two component transcriptional regulator, LuxR family n=1 Tax=Trinickia caryophylli TaxID=28094 RepID=A0A1X7DZF1_TRICW|nr:response regulator transcription factor [Trinickia caryophylli]PMS14123.1 DNA-binding response regulator [Trinickia caryophylli]TRX17822.1 response regulator transcription factor [Trinickia caryophylli]WQE11410.1 response regulator transcription factor [Trinickia caryophylli]SMF24258.1 two component transcriptional regulator, LuxR family [Trinickia caryophylli]GLU32572.1 DNA-binding response regulator [Trinickia caryophylli]
MNSRKILLLSRPKHRIKVVLLDDHPIVALGVATYLRDFADFEVGAMVSTADELLAQIEQGGYDVALVDFYLPDDRVDGAAFIRRLRASAPELVIVVLSAARAADAECLCHRAGANAFLEKATPLPLIAEVVRGAVGAPRKFFAVRGGRIETIVPLPREDTLSSAEVEILRYIAEGLSVSQTAARLRRSKKTVSTHKRSAMRKLQVSDDLGLALYLKEKFRA